MQLFILELNKFGEIIISFKFINLNALRFGFNDNMFAHYLCTMVNPTVETFRPPIIPSSSTTSINSDDKSPHFLPPSVINDRESDI